MPNRYIREDAIESEPVNDLSWQAEVFWRRLLNRVDDFGRFSAHPELLRASLFPLQLVKVSAKDVVRLLAECEEKGLLFTYDGGGKRLLVMNKWEQGRAKESKYPPPPAEVCERMQTYVYRCGHMSPTPTPTPIPTTTPTPTTHTEGAEAPKRGRMEKPTLDEVKLQASKIGLPEVEAVKFHSYYESNGWLVGKAKAPMKSWVGAMTNWKLNYEERNRGGAANGNHGGGAHGALSPAEKRNQFIIGADATQRQAELTAQREREMVERGELPL